jgi:hypothetical protein
VIEADFDVVTRAKTLKTQTKKKSVRFNSKTVPAAPIVEPIPVPDFDKLNRQIQELALDKERLLQQLASTRNPNASTLAERRCFICDGAYPHCLGPANCPDVRNLINEGLAMYSPQGRLVRPDGSDLPRNTQGYGGVARVLREERDRLNKAGPLNKGKEREVPPHFAQAAGVQCDGYDVLGHDCYAVAATPTCSYPVTRSQKGPNYEPYPSKKPEKKPRSEPTIPPLVKKTPTKSTNNPTSVPVTTQPQAIKTPKTIPKVTPQAPAPVAAPQPQPPYQNMADAWRDNKKNKPTIKKPNQQDVDMQDASKGKGGYHFTSTIQEMAEGDAIQSRILDTLITLPLRDVLGISADLQKRFANLTKTRRKYAQKATTSHGHYEGHICESEGEESGCESETDEKQQETVATTSRLQFSYKAHEDVEQILERYTSAVSLQAAPLFAMATGRFEGSMSGYDVTFMVDTGSKLNLVLEEFFRRTALPLNHDGARWSLKGINGPAVPPRWLRS